MHTRTLRTGSPLVMLLALSACGGGGAAPTTPSAPTSFLAGTWRGTLTIQPDPTGPQPPAPVEGPVTWTFEVVPQTNLQTFQGTIRSENAWLPGTFTGSAAITPTNQPPGQISTLGEYGSPRGCRGRFGSTGVTTATRIEADFTGVDCTTTFTGRVVLIRD